MIKHFNDYCEEGGSHCINSGKPKNLCFKTVEGSIATFLNSFPTFTFYFGDPGSPAAKYELRGEDYLYEDDENIWCMGISKLG
jgi:hypothetical protein